jgi:hypothetical protein
MRTRILGNKKSYRIIKEDSAIEQPKFDAERFYNEQIEEDDRLVKEHNKPVNYKDRIKREKLLDKILRSRKSIRNFNKAMSKVENIDVFESIPDKDFWRI